MGLVELHARQGSGVFNPHFPRKNEMKYLPPIALQAPSGNNPPFPPPLRGKRGLFPGLHVWQGDWKEQTGVISNAKGEVAGKSKPG